MLSWIKKRVREYEGFDFASEFDDRPTSRRDYIKAALEDWMWMHSNATGLETA